MTFSTATFPTAAGTPSPRGWSQIVDYVEKLHFGEEDIAYLRSRGIFSEGFLDYLRDFKFTGDIWAIPEGTPIFPMEPVITVRAPAIQAQLLETYLLLEFNHQSLIATKASRVCRAAQGRAVLEFGSRRAQGIMGAVTGRESRVHRRLRGHCMHRVRSGLWRSRRGHDGALMGADVRLRV